MVEQTVRSKRVMVIYGGFGGARKGNYAVAAKLVVYMSDTWKYDLDTLKWYVLQFTHKVIILCYDREKMDPWMEDGRGPGARRGHTAILFKGSMYIFGGRISESKATQPVYKAWPRVIHKRRSREAFH